VQAPVQSDNSTQVLVWMYRGEKMAKSMDYLLRCRTVKSHGRSKRMGPCIEICGGAVDERKLE
jgi:hypothetical protein